MPSAPNNSDTLTLTIDGMIYAGWTGITLERRIDRMATRIACTVTERWTSQTPAQAWQITPFSPVVVKAGNDTILTGYVDEYAAEFDGTSHNVTIAGRSKTCDLIDCTPDIASGQFKGYTLEQIARAVCQPYGINVVIQTPATQVFPDATLQRCETAFAFLERLARLSSVLLTDDEQGSLVLTTAGSTRATTRLVQGVNVLRATCALDVKNRHSQYIVKGQHAIGSAAANNGGIPGFGPGAPAAAPIIAPVVTNMRAVANDTGVPRYRPMVLMAEAQLD